MKTIHEVLETPVAYSCDVLVAGGGTAGPVAAIAAAKTGAKVLLIEKGNFLGGSLVNCAGPLHSFFNLFKGFENVEKKQVIQGVPQEIVEELVKAGGSYGHLVQEVGGDHDSTATIVDREIYKNVLNRMCRKYGVHILLNTWVTGAVKDGDTLTGVIIENKSGRQAIEAKVVVDCTGDADVAAQAGAEFVNTSVTQAVSLPYALANVDLKKVEAYAREKDVLFTMIHHDKGDSEEDIVRMGFDAKNLPDFEGFVENVGSSEDEDGQKKPDLTGGKPKFSVAMFGPWGVNYHEREWGYCNCNMMTAVDGTNAEEITRAEIELRERVVTFTEELREKVPGFERCYISWTPSFLGVRASRIVVCEYELTDEDIVNARHFEDDVAMYGYHDYAPAVKIKDGGWFGFPYRAFVPVKVDNLLCAGRNITIQHVAHMSTRNTAGCMVQGHAVGTAAALAAKSGVRVRNLDVKLLQKVLREQGAFLE